MAGLNIDLNKDISLGKQSRGKMPTKTSINLVIKKERSKMTAPVILGCILALVILTVLFLVKPLLTLTSTNARITQLQAELDETNKTIQSLGYVEDEYAHYTTQGMTAEELSRVDRVKVMKLVEDAVVNSGVVKSWELSENIVTLHVSGASLSELNQIAGALERESIVERCVINNANKGSSNTTGPVNVTFTVYLDPEGSTETDTADTEETAAEETNDNAGEAANAEEGQ